MSVMGNPLLIGAVGTVSGAVASFSDGNGSKPQSLIVNITPSQPGSGLPSPSNVRPVSGWTGADLVISPTLNAGDGTTYAISWQTEAGTVYGGTVDVISKTLTITNVLLSGTFDFVTRTSTYDQGRFSNFGFEIKSPIMSSHFASAAPTGTVGRCSLSSGRIFFNAPVNSFAAQTSEGVTQWVEDNGVQFFGTLVTPVTHQLTIADIQTLYGQNNIWASTGDVSVIYNKKALLFVS